MKKIMFLCTGNTCRSQMAEGFAKARGKGVVEAFSAGTRPEGYISPFAIRVMAEIGIDIEPQYSKAIDRSLLEKMDLIVTLCGDADETCPATPPNIEKMHVPFEDPSRVRGSEEEVLSAFRKTRDKIGEKIGELISAAE